MLIIRDLDVHYGSSHVVQGGNLEVGTNEVVALLGQNGAGKTSLVSAVTGFVEPSQGSVELEGQDITGRSAHIVARHGVALVPQGRRVFGSLTIEEHLLLPRSRTGPWTVERIYDLLPVLAERRTSRARELSGGQQQMLAIGRALVMNPTMLILDEPSEGLAPQIVEDVADLLVQLRSTDVAILLVEQAIDVALELADRVYVMGAGRIVFSGTRHEFETDTNLLQELLGAG